MMTPTETTTTQATPPAIEMHEAPYSANFRAANAEGFEIQFTLRAVTENGFLERVDHLIDRLNELQFHPVRYSNGHTAPASTNANTEPAPVCAIHKTPLVNRQGRNGSFWTCPKKLDDGTYCPYKPPKS